MTAGADGLMATVVGIGTDCGSDKFLTAACAGMTSGSFRTDQRSGASSALYRPFGNAIPNGAVRNLSFQNQFSGRFCHIFFHLGVSRDGLGVVARRSLNQVRE